MTSISRPAHAMISSPLFRSHVRTLLIQQWKVLLIVGILIWLYQFMNAGNELETPFILDNPSTFVAVNRGLGLFGGIIFLIMTALWVFATWEDLKPDSREAFHVYPVDRIRHTVVRTAAGLAVYVGSFVLLWVTGAIAVNIFMPGGGWFWSPAYHEGGWIISLFGIVNCYLLATSLALLTRRPQIWFFCWIPLGVLLTSTLLRLLNITLLANGFLFLFGPQRGLYGGLGLAVHPTPTEPWALPSLSIVLIWTVILSGVVLLSSRVRREA